MIVAGAASAAAAAVSSGRPLSFLEKISSVVGKNRCCFSSFMESECITIIDDITIRNR